MCVSDVCYIDASKKQALELQVKLTTVTQQLKEKEEQLKEKCQEIELVKG